MSNPDDQRCFARAQARGDETFTLVGQDLSSPIVICEWIKQNIHTAPDQKLRDALNDAIRMKNLPAEKKKHAD